MRAVKRPKKLYRVNPSLTEVERHVVYEDDSPQIVLTNEFGQVWRNKRLYADFHGFASLKEARTEFASHIKTEIYRLQNLLKSFEEINEAIVLAEGENERE